MRKETSVWLALYTTCRVGVTRANGKRKAKGKRQKAKGKRSERICLWCSHIRHRWLREWPADRYSFLPFAFCLLPSLVRASRTLRAKASGLKGFCKNAKPEFSTPVRTMASSV